MKIKFLCLFKFIGFTILFLTSFSNTQSFGNQEVQTTRLGIALGYMVHEICSCLFIETRTLADCEADYKLKEVTTLIEVDIESNWVKAKFRIPSNGNYVYSRTAKMINDSCILSSF